MKASGGSASSTLILDIPPYVLEELCSSMDCLSDWEWMRFASRVISNQTDLIRIHRMERMGVSVTRELLWYWEQRMATVQDLVTILQDLELYRAINILQQCFPISVKESSEKERVGPRPARAPSSKMGPPDATTPESPVQPLPSPPPVPQSLLNSFQGSCSQEALSIPQQERGGYVSSSPLLWTMEEVEQVTGQFSSTRVIHRGEFADVFRAQKENRLYAIKKLKKVESEQKDTVQSLFYTEAQVSIRCNHPNLLRLVGICVDDGCHCLIYPFMANGSLDVALQQSDTCMLSWERRLGIARGLLQAAHHLHEAGIFHGNIKSSNVLLTDDFSPRLGHSGLRCCLDRSAAYRQAKTRDLQRFQPYLPDRFLRSGQLDGQTDVFSIGVVLAELLTGMKASDEGRVPVYLKDLILEEMERGREELSGKRAGQESAESVCAKRLSVKHLDTRGGPIPQDAAFCFASAVCLCLTKKKPLLLEICDKIERAEQHFRDNLEKRACNKKSQEEMRSMNVPEESDDGSIIDVPSGVSESPRLKSCETPGIRHPGAARPEPESTYSELGASGGSRGVHGARPLYHNHCLPSSTSHEETMGCDKKRQHNMPCENHDTSCTPAVSSDSPAWGIQVNEKKRQLMMDIEMYQDGRVDSSVLFDSS